MLPNPRFSGAAKKASCDRQLAHFRPVFTRIPADPRIAIERAPAEEPGFESGICDGFAAAVVARAFLQAH